MARHFTSADAFIITESGKAVISFPEREQVLKPGSTLPIPANDPHSVTALEDFAAYLVLAVPAPSR